MCEINPKHSLFFRLEAFTANPYQTKEDFDKEVMDIVMALEMQLNESGKYRFHIHEDIDRREK